MLKRGFAACAGAVREIPEGQPGSGQFASTGIGTRRNTKANGKELVDLRSDQLDKVVLLSLPFRNRWQFGKRFGRLERIPLGKFFQF